MIPHNNFHQSEWICLYRVSNPLSSHQYTYYRSSIFPSLFEFEFFYPSPNPKQGVVRNQLLRYLIRNYHPNLDHLRNYHNFEVQPIVFNLVKILIHIYYLPDFLLYNYLIINKVLFWYEARSLFLLKVTDIFLFLTSSQISLPIQKSLASIPVLVAAFPIPRNNSYHDNFVSMYLDLILLYPRKYKPNHNYNTWSYIS